jgi:hypothetical protein
VVKICLSEFRTGTKEEFFEFFKVAVTHLKARFPNLKIGGPAMAKPIGWMEFFIPACAKEKVPLDFYSWDLESTSDGACELTLVPSSFAFIEVE